MDYIELKRTLVAAFDHFLSCHDMAELEEMMQALEAGKQLVIGFPEPIHREDYKDDALAREELNDDMAMMAKPAKRACRICGVKNQGLKFTQNKYRNIFVIFLFSWI